MHRRAFLAAAAAALARPARAEPVREVACALVLAVDVSSSIDGEHWRVQREGYVRAFLEPAVIAAITATPQGAVAVAYLEWAGAAQQRVIVPWTRVATAADGEAVAAALWEGRRPFEGSTALGAALVFAGALLESCPFQAAQRVADVSGDGSNNDGPPPEPVRDALAARGVRINGLPIDWARSHPPGGMTIAEYYRASVIGGPDAFAMPAVGFDTFGYALAAKLRREVS